MAALSELWTLFEDPSLKEKVSAACVVEADSIMNEADTVDNHANRLKWAKAVYKDPVSAGDDLLKAVIAANSDETLTTIQNATDSQIKTAVSAAVDIFADGSN